MKKIVSLLLIAALALPVAAFAAEGDENMLISAPAEEGIMPIAEEGIEVPISEEDGQIVDEAHSMFVKTEVTGAELFEEDEVQYVKGIDANGEEVHFVLDNVIIMSENGSKIALANDMSFTAFTAWDKPAPLVLPAVYYPDVIVIDTNEELLVDMDVYSKTEETYTNAAGTLQIVTEEDVDGKALVVIYGETTFSIPPIAIEPVIASFELAQEDEAIVTAVKAGDTVVDITIMNEIEMLPVRKVCEALGLNVEWDGAANAVTVGSIQMGVNFNLGVNSYRKARMTAFELKSAPIVEKTEAGGVTYVPVEFFTEVLGCETEAADGIATLKLN